MRVPARYCLLPLVAALCASSALAQSAATGSDVPALRPADPRAALPPLRPTEPESVGDRFESNNAPPGVMAGPWKVSPSLTLRGGYDDNVTFSADAPVASPTVELRGRVDIVNADGPNSIAAYAEVSQVWYTDAADLDHLDYNGGLSFSAQVSDYVRIRGSIGVASAASEDSATDGIVIGGDFDPYVDLARYLTIPASLGVTFDSGRWFVTAAGDVVYADYDDRLTAGGVLVDQGFRSGTTADAKLRAGWRFTPGTALFAEGGYNIQRYTDESADSDGWRAVVGAEFEFSRLLTGEIFAGYAAQSYPDGGEVTGLTYGASLDWFVTELMSVRLDARREFGAERTALEAGDAITSPVTRDSVRLRVEYEPLRKLLVRGEAGWQRETYDGSDRKDDRFFTGLGFDYVFTPNVRATLDYRYEERSSEVAGDATRNVFRLGLTTGY